MSSFLQQANSSWARSITATVALGALIQAMGCGEQEEESGSAAGDPEPTEEATDTDGELEDLELPEPEEVDPADPLEDEELDDPAEDNTDYEDPGAPEGDIQGGGTVQSTPLFMDVGYYLEEEEGFFVQYNPWGEEQGLEEPLNLDAETLTAIYTGEITSWGDDRIAELNSDLDLPDTEIVPVRGESYSSQNLLFTQYLAEAAGSEWDYDPDTNWPEELEDIGEVAGLPSEIVDALETTDGAISFMAARTSGLYDVDLVNIEGGEGFVEYSPEAVEAFLNEAHRAEGNVDHNVILQPDFEAPEGSGYPLVSIYHGVFCTEYSDPETAEMIRTFGEFLLDETSILHDETLGVAEMLITGDAAGEARESLDEISS